MPPLSVMFKTVSTDCNLDCSYCYYRESLEGSRIRRRIDWAMLERFVPQYMEYIADTGAANFGWQGGEPTLAGVQFFRDAVALQARHAPPRTTISNSIQTNATLLTDEWVDFFAEYNFLIGLSIDGPRGMHDAERKDRGGHGSFDKVMAGLELIRRRKIDFNVLCVVGPHNVANARELMRFFRSEGIENLQFIPAMDFQAMQPEEPPAYLVSPEAYGEFLVELFDEWYGSGAPTVSIRIFNNFLQSFLGVANDLCVHGDSCDAGLVVEYNGDVFPCDFYIHPGWKLGNVFSQPLRDMCESEARRAFIGQKRPLPAECEVCEYKPWCKGGCPRNRMSREDGSEAPDYFCASYKRFFAHAEAKLRHLRDRMTNRFRYLEQLDVLTPSQRPPSRNDGCPCGSGREFEACCGDAAFAESYLAR